LQHIADMIEIWPKSQWYEIWP